MIYQDSRTLLALVTSFHPTLSSRPFSLFILLSHIYIEIYSPNMYLYLDYILIGWSYAHLKIGKLVIRMIGDDVLCDSDAVAEDEEDDVEDEDDDVCK